MRKLGVLALTAMALMLAFPFAGAKAFDGAAAYIAPKFIYSYQMLDPNLSFTNDESDSVFGGALAFGWNFNTAGDMPVRLEIEAAMRGQSSVTNDSFGVHSNMDTKVYSAFVNAFYDIYTDSALTPYIGGGLGMAYLDYNLYARNNTTTYRANNCNYNFAWNVGGGLAYQLNDTLAFDVNYRYASFGTADGEGLDVDVAAHEVLLGLRINLY